MRFLDGTAHREVEVGSLMLTAIFMFRKQFEFLKGLILFVFVGVDIVDDFGFVGFYEGRNYFAGIEGIVDSSAGLSIGVG